MGNLLISVENATDKIGPGEWYINYFFIDLKPTGKFTR